MSEPDPGLKYDLVDEARHWLQRHRTTLDEFCDLLGAGSDQRSEICDNLRKIAIEHSVNRGHEDDTARAKSHRRSVEQYISALTRAQKSFAQIDSDFQMVIAGLANEHSPQSLDVNLRTLDAEIASVIVGAQTFLDRYQPSGIKTNIALQQSVVTLLDLIEGKAEQSVEFSGNKNKQIAPAPRTNGARAMVIFLQAISPATTTTAVYNMVEALRADPTLSRVPFDELVDVEFPSLIAPQATGD